ncbi:MAG: TonB-dependent receptor [Oligoflexia bacterium]|nr:TonB-dependent receptor [Oligoflexia bacterium]
MKKFVVLFLFPLTILAQGVSSTMLDDTIYVIGSKEKAFFIPGSAHFIDKKELETFNYTDVNRVLDKVPGVYIQEEDGLGLRPNIGLRGAHPHRSRKVTLMEDGILVGPAPYAAPAAYYFPSTSRIDSMEVFKGPSSVQYGPNSIGGAINMVTPTLFRKGNISDVEMNGGQVSDLKISNHGNAGSYSWFVQANHKEGELFKKLPTGKELEIEQNDLLMKFSKKFNSFDQKLSFKFSYADEDSDETYLGTTAQDFNANSDQRYAASQDDNMKWERYGVTTSYDFSPRSNIKVSNTVYHHQMKRNWTKFNKIAGEQDFRTALAGNNDNELIQLLKGERNSNGALENITIGANDREYFSQGFQSKAKISFDTGTVYHEANIGVRIHRDQVSRNHSEVEAAMVNKLLVYDASTNTITNRLEDTATAIAFFAEDEVMIDKLSIKVGARTEFINNTSDARDGTIRKENSESVFVPGIGVNYSLTNNAVVLAGVNKGVTLVGPGQNDNVDPEEAINYELGFRIKAPVYVEAIGFYSDYSNIKGTCSFSGGCTGADLDTQYNGGKAEIYGLESIASHTLNAGKFSFPIKLGYTFTVARFREDNISENREWGIGKIRAGDPLLTFP